MKKCIYIVLAIFVISFMTACQETPNTDVIGNKNRDILEVLNETPSSDIASDNVKKNIDVGNSKVLIEVDASVTLPESKNYPIAEIETRLFKQDEVDNIVNVLFEGRDIYYPWKKSRSDLETEIIELESEKKNPNLGDEEKNYIEAEIASLNNEWLNSPEVVIKEKGNTEFVEVSSKDLKNNDNGKEFSTSKDEKYGVVNIWSDYLENSRSVFEAYNIADGANSWMIYTRDVKKNFEGDIPVELNTKKKTNSDFDFDDAKKEAISYINRMNLDLSYTGSSLISYINYSEFENISQKDVNNKLKQIIESSEEQAYTFYFTRKIAGVPVTYDNIIKLGQLSSDYSSCMYYEVAILVLDENGIIDFDYRAPYEVKEVITENTNIISLDDAMSKFEQLMKNKYSALKQEDTINMKINSVVLGMSRIRNIDGKLLLVPTYDFFGNITTENSMGIHAEEISPFFSVATINAIDGSTIDKNIGY